MYLNDNNDIYDVAIIGCGPAGLSAAINAKRRNVNIILLGSNFCSPKMYKALEINNYLGFYDISGKELRDIFLEHVSEMGIEINRSKVDNIYDQGNYYNLITRDRSLQAYSVVLAVGVSNENYLIGEEKLLGMGVSYCATCDAPVFKDKDLAVIAYTEESLEDTNLLAEIANRVYFIPVFDNEGKLPYGVEVINDKPVGINGENKVDTLELENHSLTVDGVFIFREITPPDKIIYGLEINQSHIMVNKDMETNLPGIYAAGDCTGEPYQLARAVGQGQVAGLSAAAYVRNRKKSPDIIKV